MLDAGAEPRSISGGILYGCLTGVLLGMVSGALMVGILMDGSTLGTGPGWAMGLAAIPGLMMIAGLFALPTSALMVWLTALAGRRVRVLREWWAWSLSGALFTAPIVWLFAKTSSDALVIAAYFLVIGALSGIAAWRGWRKPA